MHARKADLLSSCQMAGSAAERTTTNTAQSLSGLERLAYGIADAAFVSGISRSKLYELLSSGTLPSVKIGARRLIRARDLAELLDRGCR
jgi:excisionase family DNA binding protein